MEGCLVFLAFAVAVAAFLRSEELRGRLRSLETQLNQLRKRVDDQGAAAASAPVVAVVTPSPVAVVTPAPPPPAVVTEAPPPAPVAVRTPAVEAPVQAAPPAPPPKPATPPPAAPPPSRAPAPPPVVTAAAVAATAAPASRALETTKPAPARTNVEEVLGAQLFLKVGVATLVVGVVLFLGYAFRMMGPAGRVAVGYLVGAGLLGGGLFAERRETYRTFGRALVAGGWAILYFVTFAAHFVAAARVVDSAAVAVVALLAVAAAAVGFSLRYRQEWTTCASFLLIYLSLFVAAVQLDAAFNLVATSIVGVSLAVLAWWMGWDRLLALGVPATWAVVAAWLLPQTYARAGAAGGASMAVLAALFIDWAAIELAVVERRAGRGLGERWPMVASLVNLAGPVLAVLHLRRLGGRDEVAVVLFGVLYLVAAARLRRLGRRELYLLSATIGIVALLAAPALYLGIASRWLSVFWLVELELVLAAGLLLRERYLRGLAHFGFTAVAIDLALVRTVPGVLGRGAVPTAVRLPLLAGGAALALANTFLLRRPWRAALAEGELPRVAYLYSGIGSVLLALLVWRHLPGVWIAPALAGAALVWTAVALRLRLRDFLWEGSGFVVLALVAAAAKNLPVDPERLSLAARAGPFALATFGLYGASLLLRREAGDQAFFLRSQLGRFASLASVAGALFALGLIDRAVPDLWQVAALAAAALLWTVVALRLRLRDLLWEGSGFIVLALASAVGRHLPVEPEKLTLATRVGPFALAALGLYGASLLLRREAGDQGFFLRSQLGRFASLASAAGALFILGLIHRAVPDLWQAAACTALAALCFLVVRWRAWADVFAEGLLASLAGIAYLVGTSWWLEGEALGLPARSVSVLAAVAFLYLAHGLLRGWALAADPESEVFLGLDARDLGRLAAGYLAAATLTLAWLVKAEALAHGKNALVALLWGLLGVVYLELGRLWRSRAWGVLGHALLAAGAVHLFLVNFVQPGWVGPASVRLLTVLPFLGMVVYLRLTARAAGEAAGLPQAEWLPVPYLYLTVAIVATLLLYELQRSWVVAAWAATAAAALLLWRWRGDPHWRLAATVLAAAAVVRGIASNLTVRDVIQDRRLNLITLPLACLLLLAGYLIVRRSELRAGAGGEGAAAGRPLRATRIAWLLATTALVTATIVVEASGTAMTVWLGAEGLAVVTLGIALRDRLARLFGLALLSFCILKLFVYDLRGLTGLARIFSFIVLGAILIAVSYAYTRFRERVKDVL